MRRRDMMVGELRELLADYPDHQLVAVGVQTDTGSELGAVLTIGVLVTGTLMQSSGLSLEDGSHGVGTTPVLVLGEPIP